METKIFNYFLQSISTRKSAVMNAFYLCFEKKSITFVRSYSNNSLNKSANVRKLLL